MAGGISAVAAYQGGERGPLFISIAAGLPNSALEAALRRAGLVTVYGVRNIPYVRLPRAGGDEDDAEPQKTRSDAGGGSSHAEDGGAHAL